MKKNKMMRLASLMLVLVLMTSCVISGTFAKYVTADSGSDNARVAKFGVVVEAEEFDMFKTDYETGDTVNFDGQYSVSSAADDRDKVLAPGTGGTFGSIKITGTPEVAVDVAIKATVALSDNWTVVEGGTAVFYCPVTVTVGTTDICGLDYDSATDFANAIKAEIEGKSEQYAPNTNLATIYDNTNLDLAWAWAFEGGTGSEQTDVKDTALGDKAVDEDLTISIGVDITVTQID